MAGIYGNSKEDRHFERMLDNHQSAFNDDACQCDIKQSGYDTVLVNDEEWEKEDVDGWCPECGEYFDMVKWFNL